MDEFKYKRILWKLQDIGHYIFIRLCMFYVGALTIAGLIAMILIGIGWGFGL